jgi:hypothetical protein
MYRITNLEGFAKAVHKEATDNFGCDGERYLTTEQVRLFVLEKSRKEDGEIVVDDEILEEISHFANSVLVGSCLSELASAGEIECAWDDEANDMVWWLPSNNQESGA